MRGDNEPKPIIKVRRAATAVFLYAFYQPPNQLRTVSPGRQIQQAKSEAPLLPHPQNPNNDPTDLRNPATPPYPCIAGHGRAIGAVETRVLQVDKLRDGAVSLGGIVGVGGFERGKHLAHLVSQRRVLHQPADDLLTGRLEERLAAHEVP